MGIDVIDTKMSKRDGITAAFVIRGRQTALVETGPKSCIDTVTTALDELGVTELDWIVVTHIHLDHAGAAGTLAGMFPDATVAVHEVGAPHLVDPTKLWSSATRIYGDAMEELWGGIDPIPADRIRSLEDGDVIDLGGRSLRAFDTPGHAYHHHAYLDDETGALFAGDALGVRLPDVAVLRPATPPPEFHLEKALASIDRIRDLEPSSLSLTHFGPQEGSVEELCEWSREALRSWGDWVQQARSKTSDLDEATAIVRDLARGDLEKAMTAEQVDRVEQTTSYWMNTWGFMRYFDKQDAPPKPRD